MRWNAALVISYGVPVPGREAAALENFANAQVFFGKLAADGRCSEPEILHHAYGGGMMIVRAESTGTLDELLQLDEGRELLATASLTSSDFGYDFYMAGERLMEGLQIYAGVAERLGYI